MVETSVFILIGIIHYILIQAGLTILYKGPKITKVKIVFVEDYIYFLIFPFSLTINHIIYIVGKIEIKKWMLAMYSPEKLQFLVR